MSYLEHVLAPLNIIDLPGSMVRDIVVGQNPFDQWLDPMGTSGRIYGRDVLRKLGMAGKRDNWGNFLAGLGVDIVTDPLVPLLGAAFKPASTSAALAKSGVLGAAQKAATSGTKNPGFMRAALATVTGKDLGTFGPRTFRLNSTVDDAMKLANKEYRAAAGMGPPTTAQIQMRAAGMSDAEINALRPRTIARPLRLTNKTTFGGRRTAQLLDAAGRSKWRLIGGGAGLVGGAAMLDANMPHDMPEEPQPSRREQIRDEILARLSAGGDWR